MRIVKLILLGLVCLIVLLLIIAAFMKKDISVTKEIIINKSRQDVFAYVKLLKNQDQYSKWGSMDPNMKKTYTGIDGTVGFTSAWVGNKDVGEGQQEILKIDEGNRIDYALRFIKPFKVNSESFITFEDAGNNQTKVSWGFKSKMPYPMNAMLLFVSADDMCGKDFQIGLENLKKKMEQ